MNRTADAFEWMMIRRSLIGLCIFFVLELSAAAASQLVPGQIPVPRGDLILWSRVLAWLATVAALVVTWRMPNQSLALTPLAFGTVAVNFGTALAIFLWGGSNVVINEAAFLLVSFFYLLVVSFFTRDQRVTLGFGAALCVLAWLFFVVWPDSLFFQPLSVEQLRAALIQVIFFALPCLTFFVYLNNQVASTLTDRARSSAERLERMAYFDSETELPNGTMLEKNLQDWNPQSLPAEAQLVLAGFRLGGLEELNSHKGLDFTTQMLQRASRSFLLALNSGLEDHREFRGPKGWHPMYRVEGSTFVLPFVVPPGTKPDTAPLEAMLKGTLGEENQRLSQGQSLRYHGGFTAFPTDTDSPRQLVRNLLTLLHSSTSFGSGRFQPFNVASYQEFVRRESIKDLLGPALGRPEFSVAFQPKISVIDGSLKGFEALARWRSGVLGSVSPAEFIPLSEQYDLIEPLTIRILEETESLVRSLNSRNHIDVRVSVNLSPGLLTPRFLTDLRERIQARGLAQNLEFEITEGILMVIDPVVIGHFRQLRGLGVAFSIDDFGTGYSNLGYLQSFEAEVLKIDKRFIDGIPSDEKNVKLVRAIVQMAQSFQMKVVAEGVEYLEQRDFLASIGCDQIQGYYYSKPLAMDQALEFAARAR